MPKPPKKDINLLIGKRVRESHEARGISPQAKPGDKKTPEPYEEKLLRHCQQLLNLIKGVQKAYLKITNEDERRYIEITIGAAIYYLPHQHNRLWSGLVSEAAIKDHHPESGSQKPRLTRDHFYVRKQSARVLLNQEWLLDEQSAKKNMQLFLENYGRFHYVSPTENSRLKQYQEGGEATPNDAYKAAGIRLIKVDPKLLSVIRRRDKGAINQLLEGK